MQLTIEVPEGVIARAAELGVPVSTLVEEALKQVRAEPVPEGFARLGVATRSPQAAAAAIREIASKHTLGGLKIKDLIEEGRRL